MDNINLMKYWINSSDEDYDAMQVMYKNKKNTWTLFLGHLVIEKLLKGLYAKKNEENPYTIKSHNLLALAEKFNISARYDDYKENFKQKCTDKYTSEQVKNIEEVRKWLKELLTVE